MPDPIAHRARRGLHTLWQALAGASPGVHRAERLRAAAGALTGILLTGLVAAWLLGYPEGMLIAPMGASAVLLFALPASPLAQPWPILAGNMLSALAGVFCATTIDALPVAAAAAMALALLTMFALRCLHPPGGAIALTAVLGGPAIKSLGYAYALAPVGLNSLLLLLVAIGFNNLTRHQYPHRHHERGSGHGTRDKAINERVGFTREDLEAVIAQYDQVLDIDTDDLDTLFRQTEMHAYRRRFGEIACADIMSRDVICVEFGTSLEEGWALLRDHRIKALPVVDRARRVIGIVTLMDFMKHAHLDRYDGFDRKLRAFIARTLSMHSEKPEVIGQIMTTRVVTATARMHIVELVPKLSDGGLHHIPIVNDERRLVGMVTQSDLVAALYRGRVTER